MHFFLTALLLEKQYVSILIELLNLIPLEDSKETVLNAMFTFVEGFYDAICECKKEEHNLIPTLEYLIAHYNTDNIVSIRYVLEFFFCSFLLY